MAGALEQVETADEANAVEQIPPSRVRLRELLAVLGLIVQDSATFVMGLWDQRKLIHLAILNLLV